MFPRPRARHLERARLRAELKECRAELGLLLDRIRSMARDNEAMAEGLSQAQVGHEAPWSCERSVDFNVWHVYDASGSLVTEIWGTDDDEALAKTIVGAVNTACEIADSILSGRKEDEDEDEG